MTKFLRDTLVLSVLGMSLAAANADSVKTEDASEEYDATEDTVAKKEKIEEAKAPKWGKIVVWTSERCGFCDKLKDLLNSKGIPYETMKITSQSQVDELEKKSGKRTVPQVFVNDKHVGGYAQLSMADSFGNLNDILQGKSSD
jgi:glutaredoxin 3